MSAHTHTLSLSYLRLTLFFAFFLLPKPHNYYRQLNKVCTWTVISSFNVRKSILTIDGTRRFAFALHLTMPVITKWSIFSLATAFFSPFIFSSLYSIILLLLLLLHLLVCRKKRLTCRHHLLQGCLTSTTLFPLRPKLAHLLQSHPKAAYYWGKYQRNRK